MLHVPAKTKGLVFLFSIPFNETNWLTLKKRLAHKPMQISMQKINIEMTGIVLFTENFEACVRFYHELLGLPIAFKKPGLICLDFCHSYLMIEAQGFGKEKEKSRKENPITIRFNVASVEESASILSRQGISIQILKFEWGTIGVFIDPDGNRCELKNSDHDFERIKNDIGARPLLPD